jgi:hypothetical protein
MADYIPPQDGPALTWLKNFAGKITLAPAVYQLTAGDAATIQAAVDEYEAAFDDANDPATRTPVTVALKDSTRNSAVQLARQYAGLIKPNAGISDASKIAAGVPPVNNSRSPINVPTSSPLLNIVVTTPGSQTIRYADSNTPDKGAKPFGAAQIQLFVAIGTDAIEDADQAEFYGAFTKNPVGVAFTPGDDGKVATYFARWASRRGETGPWSLPVSMRIAA